MVQGKKKVILITEDEPAMMKALIDTLVRAGLTVLQAKDGEEGLAMAQKEHPDAILLDVLMPKMDGIAMMERLRADQWGKTVPIIILTNLDTSSNMISTILKDQPAYYLLKANTKLEDLVEKVKDVLGEQP
jgi:two-component system response regulator MprA